VLFSGPTTDRQRAVVEAMQHAWKGYKKFAWGHDHLKPISASYHDWFFLGLTIVDSVDTLYIMNLKNGTLHTKILVSKNLQIMILEYAEAKEWISKNLRFDKNRDVNLFEVTIRVLGGLLSAYHLTAEKVFLDKAVRVNYFQNKLMFNPQNFNTRLIWENGCCHVLIRLLECHFLM
jgi:endoplasmic reticulum Man9GlcNAc2 1,2-alpha-mannosidase